MAWENLLVQKILGFRLSGSSPLHLFNQVALDPRLAGIGRQVCLLAPLKDRTWKEVQAKSKVMRSRLRGDTEKGS